ncbi:MAG TPA: DciA family protein [Thermoguttaceae bacterium]|nr:DciA family protein [Thermoguttaceae bacterium]
MARGPQAIGDVLVQLMARRGFAGVRRAATCEEAWRQAAGELAAGYSRVGAVRRGTLEVLVANSTLLQELTFQKQTLLETLGELLPDEKIRDLRFRLGAIE